MQHCNLTNGLNTIPCSRTELGFFIIHDIMFPGVIVHPHDYFIVVSCVDSNRWELRGCFSLITPGLTENQSVGGEYLHKVVMSTLRD